MTIGGFLDGQAGAGRGLSVGPSSGLGETIGAAFDYTWKNYTTAAPIQYQGLPLNERNDLIKKRFGQDITDITGVKKKYPNPTAEGQVKMMQEANDLIDGWIEQGRVKMPEKYMGIKTSKEIRDDARKIAGISEQHMNEIMIRNPSAVSRTAGALVGGIGAAAVDPINAATMFFGAGEIQAGLKGFAAARAVMRAAVIEGTINAGIEAATQPTIAAWQKELGHRYGFAEAAENVGLAFAGGAALSGLIRGGGALIRRGADYSGSVSADVLDTIASNEKMPQNVRDAASFMSRQAHIDESAPPKMIETVEDLKAHRETAQKVAEDFETYKTRADMPEKTPEGNQPKSLVQKEEIAKAPEKEITPEFKQWFKDSQVKNTEGKPLMVFHGTKKAFDEFDIQASTNIGKQEGEGFYFTARKGLANKFAEGEGGNIRPVYLNIKKPFDITSEKADKKLKAIIHSKEYTPQQKTQSVKDAGYDGIVMRHEDGDTWVAFDKEQIKPVFSPEVQSGISEMGDLMPAERMQEPPPLPESAASGDVPPERMAIAESEMKGLVDELGGAQIALDDGRMVSVADFNEEIQAKKAIIEAMNTCRLK